MDISPLVKRLAHVADSLGMYAADLLRFPEVLQEHGIDPTAVYPGIAHSADQLNREATNRLLDRYKPLKSLPYNDLSQTT